MGLIRNIRKGFMFLGSAYSIPPEDASLLVRHLSDAERELFLRMDPPDQEHSLRVARKVLEALAGYEQLDAGLLTTAALLHDVGKIGARLGLVFRTLWVAGHRFAPYVLDRYASRGEQARPGSARHKMWVQLVHARLGAEMLEAAGSDPAVADLVRATGRNDEADDSTTRLVLLAADADRVLTPVTEEAWREELRGGRDLKRPARDC